MANKFIVNSYIRRYQAAKIAIDKYTIMRARSRWIDMLEAGEVDFSKAQPTTGTVKNRKPLLFKAEKDALYLKLKAKYYARATKKWRIDLGLPIKPQKEKVVHTGNMLKRRKTKPKYSKHKIYGQETDGRLAHRVRLDAVLERLATEVLKALEGSDQFSKKFETLNDLRTARYNAEDALERILEIRGNATVVGSILHTKAKYKKQLKQWESKREKARKDAKKGKTGPQVVGANTRFANANKKMAALREQRDDDLRRLSEELKTLNDTYF